MKKLALRLDTKSIKKVKDEIEKYQLSLQVKSEELVNRLLDEGIKVAYQHVPSRYSGYIEFTKEVTGEGTQCVGLFIGRNTQTFVSRWVTKAGVQEADVNALAMAEFGSGWLANVIWNVSGVGQGTFPGQTHATDQMWFWVDEDGIKHHSRGEPPSYPMYNADMAMLSQIDSIAREVFNDI